MIGLRVYLGIPTGKQMKYKYMYHGNVDVDNNMKMMDQGLGSSLSMRRASPPSESALVVLSPVISTNNWKYS